VDFWDFFISNGFWMCEINPWCVTAAGEVYACDFKAVLDESNFKARNLAITFPEYPENFTPFEEEMKELAVSSYQGQLHVSDLGGDLILPLLFGGGASTIITETLITCGGDPIFLSDFGGNPPYERMHKAAAICFKHYLKKAALLLILGGKANNTLIDVTFQGIGDALQQYVEEHGPVHIPVVIGRGGPRLARGMIIIKEILETLRMPYVIFGHDTPSSMVAEYAARLAKACAQMKN
jgi:succinyl-CoA synthetase beta subunit